ncbi:TIGR03085 family metal-binding protein [Gordonia sp. NPDC003425]
MSLAQNERAALVETLRRVGPDAPTLCEGWTSRDLAAHLVIRERRPDAAVGIMVSPLAGYTKTVQDKTATEPWQNLLDQIASGPPWYSPIAPLDRWVNLGEMFIHHEDVLRGGADPAGPWLPRELTPDASHALRTPLTSMGRMTLRKAPARVTLATPDGDTVLAAGKGEPVTVTGTIGELLLFATGRAPVDVSMSGDQRAVDAVVGTARGF